MIIYTGNSSHYFVYIHLAVIDIATHSKSFRKFSDILHSISTIVGRKGARLTYRVNMSHISNRRTHYLVLILDGII